MLSCQAIGSGFVWLNVAVTPDPVGLFFCLIYDTVQSLRCLFVLRSSLCIHAEWRAAACMLVEKTDYSCLTGNSCVFVRSCGCVTVCNSPRRYKQHCWKVSCLCLQIDMISLHCENPLQTLHRLTHLWSFSLSLCFSVISSLVSYHVGALVQLLSDESELLLNKT